MSELFKISENGLNIVLEVTESKDVRLIHFSSKAYDEFDELPEEKKKYCRLLELQFTGEDQIEHRGIKHTGTLPGNRMRFQELSDIKEKQGRKITITLLDEITNVYAYVNFQFYENIPVVKTWTRLENQGEEAVGIEYVSSLSITGFDKGGLSKREDKISVAIPRNEWYGEAMWREFTLEELGIFDVIDNSTRRMLVSNTGNWSTCQYAPLGFLKNKETGEGLLWQIEHNGSWNYEISSIKDMLYLKISGPNESENHWWKKLNPKDNFDTVAVSAAVSKGELEDALGIITKYRRIIRRENDDNKYLPIIFNDYMNCLMGDPTTEVLIPLIDAAEKAGCEYFCIDCGWYSDGYWWDGVGEWLPSKRRFPNGISEPLNYIKEKGMIPGLWIELEVMGIKCPLANKLPDDWFFMRHGKRIIDQSRYQLDYRNPDVRAFATGIIDRLVNDYGIGYIKMDYNIDMGIGNDNDADSPGDGLLEHNRAYLGWLDKIFKLYPNLVIENCSSGGMRMDYALLSRHSIQSTSDQTDYKKNAVIAAAVGSLVTPEQGAVWSYPLRNGDNEEVICNMVNSMLGRIHQSGHLAEISEERFKYVQEGINYYKTIRSDIKDFIPMWPTGIPTLNSNWFTYGLKGDKKDYLSVWRINSNEDIFMIDLSHRKGKNIEVKLTYPKDAEVKYSWNKEEGVLTVENKIDNSARIF